MNIKLVSLLLMLNGIWKLEAKYSSDEKEQKAEKLTSRMNALLGEFETIEDYLQMMKDCIGLVYKAKCYFLLPKKTTYEGAKKACQASGNGAKIAKIKNKTLYGLLRGYITATYDGFLHKDEEEVGVWIDGKYSNGKVHYENGDKWDLTPLWAHNFPNTCEDEHVYIGFYVAKYSKINKYNMENLPNGHHMQPLCQR